MSKIVWDKIGERYFETGVDRGVLFVMGTDGYGVGVPWNGLTGISESPSGAEANAQWADNIKYLNIISREEFAATIEAFTYPNEFGACDGTAEPEKGVFIGQQARKVFGLCYRTLLGNDVEGQDHGYKLHFIYGCTAAPSEKSYQTVNDSPEAITFSWEVSTTPVDVEGHKPTASLTVDSTKVDSVTLAQLEDIVYGKNGTGEDDTGSDSRLPMPAEIIEMFKTSIG